jgi:hypothetical protein
MDALRYISLNDSALGHPISRLLARRRKPGIGSDGCHAQHAGGTADLLIYEGER